MFELCFEVSTEKLFVYLCGYYELKGLPQHSSADPKSNFRLRRQTGKKGAFSVRVYKSVNPLNRGLSAPKDCAIFKNDLVQKRISTALQHFGALKSAQKVSKNGVDAIVTQGLLENSSTFSELGNTKIIQKHERKRAKRALRRVLKNGRVFRAMSSKWLIGLSETR